jgi:methionyl-tRNA synthetase
MVIKSDQAEAAKIIRFGFNLMLFFGEISEPFIPETSLKVKNCFGKQNSELRWDHFKRDFTSVFERVQSGEEYKSINNLFKKIEDSDTLALEKRFAGTDV